MYNMMVFRIIINCAILIVPQSLVYSRIINVLFNIVTTLNLM